jgi:hypothetical protein
LSVPFRLLGLLVGLVGVPLHVAAALTLVAVSPSPQSLQAEPDTPVVLHFDAAVDRGTFSAGESVRVLGRWSGPLAGSLSFSHGDSVVTWTPAGAFAAGDRALVVVSNQVRAMDGSALRQAGYSFRFWIRTQAAALDYRELQRFSVRSDPLMSTRAYGGSAADLNGDGALDLAIVNEDTADLRVFLNSGDAHGTFDTNPLPPTTLGPQASPSETGDFDGDGNVDLCVANIRDNSVSILLGNGDGSFRTTRIPVGSAPRGIAVLDANGDGHLDVVNTNAVSDNLSMLRNLGDGTFATPVFFDGGGEGEWALEAADFDHDGILDLAVGAQISQTVIVNRGVGDGSFVPGTPRDCSGRPWQLSTGDVNGDGHTDVVVVNGPSDNAAVLRGDASGQLGRATLYLPDAFVLATDLGDLDGDGDLDWVTSSFSGDWFLYRNDGLGSFQVQQTVESPSAASCALLLDINRDGDLDIALIDEIADMVLILENTHVPTSVQPTSWSDVRALYRGKRP